MIRKITLLLAIAPFASAVQAQSMVTLAGVVDGGIRYTNTGAGSAYSMNSNGLFTSNRLDFIGREDLGGGYNAHFRLESGFNLGNGAFDNTNGLIFNRMSYVGLGGWFGSLDFGRQFTVAHDVIYDYDPFHFEYPGIIPLTPATAGTRFNNDVKYTQTYGPFRVRAENSFGGMTDDFNAGAARSVGLQYKWGWLNVGGVYTYRTVLVGTTYVPDNYYAFGAALTFGPVVFAGGMMNDNRDSTPSSADVRTLNYWGGFTYEINPFMHVGAGYYMTDLPNQSGKRSQGLVSLAYSLSKRTTLYTEADYTKFSGSYITNKTLNAAGQPHQMAVSVGINHAF
ncbi:porin [Paraburkholderia gardini]|uniref:Outer membrane porin protein 32 n=1 Tax=Paraburkholderia gardini TaxID=2823469 RepID=A0ABN7QTN7_9BURK|nr:porin [Paraburkholderia gardini]CAG4923694.1 Outer membrane porin protein 32 [Paraburkholderia gardini]